MTTQQAPSRRARSATRSIPDRILIGVDGTKESLDACRQAARLDEATSTRSSSRALTGRDDLGGVRVPTSAKVGTRGPVSKPITLALVNVATLAVPLVWLAVACYALAYFVSH